MVLKDGECVSLCICTAVVCLALPEYVCMYPFVLQSADCKLTISHSRHSNSFSTIPAVECKYFPSCKDSVEALSGIKYLCLQG